MRYRTKVQDIEAFQVRLDNATEARPCWLVDAINNGVEYRSGVTGFYYSIETPEGSLLFANIGDWIIRDENGVIYPCRDNIFRAKYVPVDEGGC